MIHNSKTRNGNFTSSEIVALTKEGKAKGTPGAPFLTYIEEKNMERRLGRSLEQESNAKPMVWGKLLENRVFNLLGLEYSLTSQETDVHPDIPFWVGSKDGLKEDEGRTVIDIKCPITLKSFCNLVDPLYDGLTGMDAINSIRNNHKDGDKYYWQLVSNAIINDCQWAELIVYVPYESELQEIKQSADGQPNAYWITMGNDCELPYLKNDGFYNNVNIIRFEIPQQDKDLLTLKVKMAGEMLHVASKPEKANMAFA